MISTERVEVEQVWFMGVLVSETETLIPEDHAHTIPEPPVDENGTFTFADRTWMVVRDDSPLWDREITIVPTWRDSQLADGTTVQVLNSNPDDPANHRIRMLSGGREGWLTRLEHRNGAAIQEGLINGWWDVDANGNPQQLAIKVSIQDMVAQNKPLMAHLMVDLKFFSSVSQAKKNGWDKPLELGRHELGPKKKRAFVEIIP
jgi:hypothetical protein